jgi:hypothetical protein
MVVSRWDVKWKACLAENRIDHEDDGRYVEDGRLFLYEIRAGYRWWKGNLWFCQAWEREDRELSGLERTKRVLAGSMEGHTKCLKFTVETEEEFADSGHQVEGG